MYQALHPRNDIDKLYESRKKRGRGPISIEDIIDASVWWLEDYAKKSRGRQITVIRKDTDNRNINRTTITRQQKWEEKQLDISSDKHTRKLGHG